MAEAVLTRHLPNIDPPILSYLSGYIDDPTSHLESNTVILETVSAILLSYLRGSTSSEADASTANEGSSTASASIQGIH